MVEQQKMALYLRSQMLPEMLFLRLCNLTHDALPLAMFSREILKKNAHEKLHMKRLQFKISLPKSDFAKKKTQLPKKYQAPSPQKRDAPKIKM